MNRSLLADVSLSELQQMRENGLSNYEIAQNLNVSTHTINKYLGPGGPRKPRERKPKRPDYKERARQFNEEYNAKYFTTTPATVPDTATEDIPGKAYTLVYSQTTILAGEDQRQYVITQTDKGVVAYLNEAFCGSNEFSADDIEQIINELQSVRKFMRENNKLPLTVY